MVAWLSFYLLIYFYFYLLSSFLYYFSYFLINLFIYLLLFYRFLIYLLIYLFIQLFNLINFMLLQLSLKGPFLGKFEILRFVLVRKIWRWHGSRVQKIG